jgi:hypothetical protein
MAWDSSRPVPWNRLIREWLIYAAIMSAVFVIFFRGDNVLGAIAGVLISGPLYLAFGAVMAKFGYQRTRLRDVRGATDASADASGSAPAAASDGVTGRPKPMPTSRTAGGGNRPRSASRRKR